MMPALALESQVSGAFFILPEFKSAYNSLKLLSDVPMK